MTTLRRRDLVAMGAIALCAAVVIAVTAFATAGSDAGTTTVTSTVSAKPTMPRSAPPPPAIDQVLLTPDAVKTALGTWDFKVLSDNDRFQPALGPKLAVAPPECLEWGTLANATTYAGVDWRAVQRSVMERTNDPTPAPGTVMQSVVVMASSDVTTQFLTTLQQTWTQCRGKVFQFGSIATERFVARDLTQVDGYLIATAVRENVDFHCTTTMFAKGVFVVGAHTCGIPDDAGQKLVERIVANLPK